MIRGVKLVPILTGSLTDDNGPAPTYIDYIRYNVKAIVEAFMALDRRDSKKRSHAIRRQHALHDVNAPILRVSVS